MTHMLQTRKCQ